MCIFARERRLMNMNTFIILFLNFTIDLQVSHTHHICANSTFKQHFNKYTQFCCCCYFSSFFICYFFHFFLVSFSLWNCISLMRDIFVKIVSINFAQKFLNSKQFHSNRLIQISFVFYVKLLNVLFYIWLLLLLRLFLSPSTFIHCMKTQSTF